MVPRPTQYEFAQADSLLQVRTAREAASLPYSFIVVLWEFAQPVSSSRVLLFSQKDTPLVRVCITLSDKWGDFLLMEISPPGFPG